MSARGRRFGLVVGNDLDGTRSYGERATSFSDGIFSDPKYWAGGGRSECYPGWVLYTLSPISGERAEYYPEKPPTDLIPPDVIYWVLYEFGIEHLQARTGGGSARTVVGNTVDDIRHGAQALRDAGAIPGQIAKAEHQLEQAEGQLVEIKYIALGALALGGVYVVAKLVGGIR